MADPDGLLRACSQRLADEIEAALPTWVVDCVARIMTAWAGTVPPAVAAQAAEAGSRAQAQVGRELRALLEADVDEQRSTPLAVVRGAVRFPTEVLAAAGVPPVERDSFAERAFPADVYDLTPASFTDLAPELAEVGVTWGAAKAFAHRRRHLPPEASRPGA